eukprot:TRINITY_DN12503_c0_g1_i13.p1 TRINITY_DN12503_c0_g1~~TRINITY_DN12503_c0_g1_i13.p1  ORF type:complete len:462 (+),score=38.55 TRINITY_DN12503_c0_g1_i13:379-1764(+)
MASTQCCGTSTWRVHGYFWRQQSRGGFDPLFIQARCPWWSTETTSMEVGLGLWLGLGGCAFDRIRGLSMSAGDESMSYATKHLDHASATKCEAEQLVLGADCPDFHTCALRPEMIFGPGDNSFVPKILDKAREGEMTHMIGDGANVVDFTYIDNVILAHLLAAEHLFQGSPVCGSAYFITNGEVMPFWEFLRRILGGMGFPVPTKAIGTTLAYGTAYALEKVGGLLNYFVRFKPKLTRQLVFNMSKNHYFKHTKATQDFGYKPVVTLEEGIHRTLGFYRTNQAIRVSVDLRIFDMWNICRTSLWGGDKEALSLQPSRATSTASLDSLEGMGLILEPRHSGSRRLSFGGEFVGSPDESEVLEELNGMQLHARKSIPGLHGASPEQAPDQPDESSRAVPRKGRSSPGRKSPGHVPAGFCPPILEHTEHTVRHTELTSIKPEPVRSSLNSRTNLVHPHPMVSSS